MFCRRHRAIGIGWTDPVLHGMLAHAILQLLADDRSAPTALSLGVKPGVREATHSGRLGKCSFLLYLLPAAMPQLTTGTLFAVRGLIGQTGLNLLALGLAYSG